MSLTTRMQTDVVTALKAGQKELVGTLRLVVSELKRAAIDAREELTEEQEIAILQRQLKQRREAAEAFTAGDRPELAAKELREAEVLEAYMPEQLGDDELAAAVRELVAETGAAGPRDMGKVMGPLLKRFAGRLEGNRARAAVQAALGG